jgi:hypothetical protein
LHGRQNADAKNGPASRAFAAESGIKVQSHSATTVCEVDPALRQIAQTGSNLGSAAKRQRTQRHRKHDLDEKVPM